MEVCDYEYAFKHIQVYAFKHALKHKCTYAYMCVHVCVGTGSYLYACRHVYLWAYVRVSMYVYM